MVARNANEDQRTRQQAAEESSEEEYFEDDIDISEEESFEDDIDISKEFRQYNTAMTINLIIVLLMPTLYSIWPDDRLVYAMPILSLISVIYVVYLVK